MSASFHVVCPNCGTVNRVLETRLGEGRCGRCKQILFTGQPVTLDDSNFDVQVGKSDLPVVVDFWAPWCGPCRMMAPHFERAAAEMEPSARLAKLNTEDSPRTAARFNCRDVITRGFVLDARTEALLKEIPGLVGSAIEGASVEERTDPGLIKEKIRVDLQRFFRKRSGLRPFVLPVVMEI